ncbi:hypothetical protein [Halobacillus naozhouensis]|uniref:Lipoprotein n=1 Tax=Halobacillus naozhouensis TaxID=554880 RepID=A0ABY8IYS2_9BACI|nr:hypothetical protein [Halobacillus naozhouensis]WFT73700.1 hypothetical protein P9989_15160 [Halobacillus naozhouensis]
MEKRVTLVVILIFLSGCSILSNLPLVNTQVNHDGKSATITTPPSEFLVNEKKGGILYGHEFIGVPNEFGLLNVPVTLKEPTDLYIYFWGKGKDFISQDLKIKATNTETNKQVTVKDIEIKELQGPVKTPETGKSGLIPLETNGAETVSKNPVAFATTKITLPEKGEWDVNIIKQGKLYTNFTLDIVENDSSLEKLDSES